MNNVVTTTVIEMVEMVGKLDGRLGKRPVERVRYVINNLLHLVIVKYGDISLVLCISTRLRHVTILSLLVKYLVIFHADTCNKSYISRGGHSCTNTRDRGQELGQAVKAENLEGQAVKGTSQIRKSQGSSTVKVNRIQNLIKARYNTLNSVKSKAYLSDGQGPN